MKWEVRWTHQQTFFRLRRSCVDKKYEHVNKHFFGIRSPCVDRVECMFKEEAMMCGKISITTFFRQENSWKLYNEKDKDRPMKDSILIDITLEDHSLFEIKNIWWERSFIARFDILGESTNVFEGLANEELNSYLTYHSKIIPCFEIKNYTMRKTVHC